MAYDVDQLLEKTDSELDAMFSQAEPGPIPNGKAEGTAIVANGTKFSNIIARIINHFGWQGKTFDAKHGTLRNRITAFGLNAIVAEVYVDKSLFDGKPCIVLDYSKTSFVARMVRDEVRLVGPGLYLGVVWLWRRRVGWFTIRTATTVIPG